MQYLQEVQKMFNLVGFSPKLKPLNRRILVTLVLTFSALILMWIFLIQEADGAHENIESIYFVSASSSIFLCFASTILTKEKLFSFIDSLDEFFNERKSKFKQLNRFRAINKIQNHSSSKRRLF